MIESSSVSGKYLFQIRKENIKEDSSLNIFKNSNYFFPPLRLKGNYQSIKEKFFKKNVSLNIIHSRVDYQSFDDMIKHKYSLKDLNSFFDFHSPSSLVDSKVLSVMDFAGNVEISCKICKRVFLSKASLKRHKNAIHPSKLMKKMNEGGYSFEENCLSLMNDLFEDEVDDGVVEYNVPEVDEVDNNDIPHPVFPLANGEFQRGDLVIWRKQHYKNWIFSNS